MLSWRDITHPQAGGAEKVTFELLKRWSRLGVTCTWFSAGKGTEVKEGVQLVRSGGRLSVYWKAYRFLSRSHYDVVIDQVNTIPFFTPLYYKGRSVALFHQLCEEVWFYEMGFPLNYIGYYAEKMYLSLYKHTPALTISESSKNCLRRHGIRGAFVMSLGVDSQPLAKVGAKKEGSLVYVGRLKRSKRVDEAILAVSIVAAHVPSVKLHIVGKGEEEERLKELVTSLNLSKNVIFHGFLPKAERNTLLKESCAILVTSVKEGWGLIVTEANAFGTPAIVYNVDGLRDSVLNGRTGVITPKNTPASLAGSIVGLLSDDKLRKELSENALEFAKRYKLNEEEVLNYVMGAV